MQEKIQAGCEDGLEVKFLRLPQLSLSLSLAPGKEMSFANDDNT